MMYTAFVKDKETKQFLTLERSVGKGCQYSTKKDFMQSLRENGYSIKHCELKDVYDFLVNETNMQKDDWICVKYMQKKHIPLTPTNFVYAYKDAMTDNDAKFQKKLAKYLK